MAAALQTAVAKLPDELQVEQAVGNRHGLLHANVCSEGRGNKVRLSWMKSEWKTWWWWRNTFCWQKPKNVLALKEQKHPSQSTSNSTIALILPYLISLLFFFILILYCWCSCCYRYRKNKLFCLVTGCNLWQHLFSPWIYSNLFLFFFFWQEIFPLSLYLRVSADRGSSNAWLQQWRNRWTGPGLHSPLGSWDSV